MRQPTRLKTLATWSASSLLVAALVSGCGVNSEKRFGSTPSPNGGGGGGNGGGGSSPSLPQGVTNLSTGSNITDVFPFRFPDPVDPTITHQVYLFTESVAGGGNFLKMYDLKTGAVTTLATGSGVERFHGVEAASVPELYSSNGQVVDAAGLPYGTSYYAYWTSDLASQQGKVFRVKLPAGKLNTTTYPQVEAFGTVSTVAQSLNSPTYVRIAQYGRNTDMQALDPTQLQTLTDAKAPGGQQQVPTYEYIPFLPADHYYGYSAATAAQNIPKKQQLPGASFNPPGYTNQFASLGVGGTWVPPAGGNNLQQLGAPSFPALYVFENNATLGQGRIDAFWPQRLAEVTFPQTPDSATLVNILIPSVAGLAPYNGHIVWGFDATADVTTQQYPMSATYSYLAYCTATQDTPTTALSEVYLKRLKFDGGSAPSGVGACSLADAGMRVFSGLTNTYDVCVSQDVSGSPTIPPKFVYALECSGAAGTLRAQSFNPTVSQNTKGSIIASSLVQPSAVRPNFWRNRIYVTQNQQGGTIKVVNLNTLTSSDVAVNGVTYQGNFPFQLDIQGGFLFTTEFNFNNGFSTAPLLQPANITALPEP